MIQSKIEKGMKVRIKDDDYTSKPYKVLSYDKETVTVEIVPPIRMRKGNNLKVPKEKVVFYE